MHEAIYLIVGSAFGLIVGVVAGWLLASRQRVRSPGSSADLESRLADVDAELKRSIEARIVAEKTSATAEAQLQAANDRNAELRQVHADQFAAAKLEQERNMVQMRDSFSVLSTEAISRLQPQFLELAGETFAKHNETAKGDISKKQEAIAAMLKPVEELLKLQQERLAQSETNQATAIGDIKKHLDVLAENSASLSGETIQLRRVLSSSQARGRWGEETLKRVVEASGMSAHCDFSEQVTRDDSRPDMIVRLPGNRMIIIDSKVPDFDILDAQQEGDDVKRRAAFKAHADKLRLTVRGLAERDYPSQFPGSLDSVILFLPAESLFSAALEGDADLIVWAASKKIMLATPASLIAILRSVSVSWQQNSQTENAREIVATAGELYSRVATFVGHFDAMRAGLMKANEAYNSAVGSYERSVRPSGERVLKLGGENSGKQLAEPALIPDTLRLAPVIRS